MMSKYIALLRGINVSGQKKIKMSELREQLTSIGLEQVETYIQSGNVIFNYKRCEKDYLVNIIVDKIEKHFGFVVPCIVLETIEIESILKHNPFLDKDIDTKYMYFSILSEKPKLMDNSTIEVDSKNDEFQISNNVIYVFTPGGYGKTKLNNNFFERKLKQKITTRNWKTLNKLLDMTKIPT